MSIVINLDVMMAKRKIGLTELSKEVDITMANLSILKNNKAKAVRFSTLNAICRALHCQPGDILEYVEDADDGEEAEREEKRLVRLSELLRLEVVPDRIEAYDISNIGNENINASMIVYENGKFKRSDYRRFNIKTTAGADDYGSMREALSRRFSHIGDGSPSLGERPDLILVEEVIESLLGEAVLLPGHVLFGNCIAPCCLFFITGDGEDCQSPVGILSLHFPQFGHCSQTHAAP